MKIEPLPYMSVKHCQHFNHTLDPWEGDKKKILTFHVASPMKWKSFIIATSYGDNKLGLLFLASQVVFKMSILIKFFFVLIFKALIYC